MTPDDQRSTVVVHDIFIQGSTGYPKLRPHWMFLRPETKPGITGHKFSRKVWTPGQELQKVQRQISDGGSSWSKISAAAIRNFGPKTESQSFANDHRLFAQTLLICRRCPVGPSPPTTPDARYLWCHKYRNVIDLTSVKTTDTWMMLPLWSDHWNVSSTDNWWFT